ncbi:MAG: MetQ/NlpA family ABC transporter substrate-binding protein [Clostridia bacterium]|nr:MetQ/NlpA family ABC transporter substrate-binding protein [Clostridia bacterium]
MKKLFALTLALILTLSFSTALAENQKIVIGATPSPHAEILEYIKDDLAELGYDLEIKIFTEYPLPNPALAAGELDANYFQHQPYLNAYNETVPEDEQLVPVIGVHYEPYAVYSNKITDIADLPDGAIVSVTNDPANEARALLLLESAGLITLGEDVTPYDALTKEDIVENPKNLEIKEIDANQLPSTLDDVDIAVINGNFALDAGLSPAKDSIFIEPADGEAATIYANYVVVRPEDVDADWVKALEQVLCSEKVADFMLENETYAGGVIPFFSYGE